MKLQGDWFFLLEVEAVSGEIEALTDCMSIIAQKELPPWFFERHNFTRRRLGPGSGKHSRAPSLKFNAFMPYLRFYVKVCSG